MVIKSNVSKLLLAGCAVAALGACGADDVASPGSGGNIIIENPTPTPTPTPTTGTVEPAGGCPSVEVDLTDGGTITGPTGTWRVCTLPAQITANTTLPKISGLVYKLDGRVDVGSDLGPSGGTGVTLTIQPGVILVGKTASWLAVNRGNKIMAVGEADKPIIFTSEQNISGSTSDSTSGHWGGVVLLGRAPITDCSAPAATPGTDACFRTTEGSTTNAYYGGEIPGDSSGELKYVQIRYSGYVLSGNSELQGLTPSGIGTGTKLEYIQIHNSSDDGIEFFGGHPNAKHLVITGAEDDSLDIDTGAKAFLQYVLVVQRPETGKADSFIEGDSDNPNDVQTPRTNLRLANFTFVRSAGAAGNGAAIMLRGGMDASLVNGVVVSPDQACLQLRNPLTLQESGTDEAGKPKFTSVVMQCASSGAFSAFSSSKAEDQPYILPVADIQAAFEAGTNVNATFTASLSSIFINGANETAAAAADPAAVVTGSPFDSASYVGAVKDANDTWYRGWTCDSGFASFGSDSACSTVPTA